MFDQAPNNLPTEPEDILADGNNTASSAGETGSPPAVDAGGEPATALSAGRLRPAADPSPSSMQSAGTSSGAGLSHARSFAQSMNDNPHDSASEDMRSDVEISPPILNKRNLFIMAVAVLLILIAGGAFWVWRSSAKRDSASAPASQSKNEVPAAPSANENTPADILAPATATTTKIAEPQPPSPAIDADGDGLTDQQEIQYGTDPQKADTDGDALTDYEEIFIWHTNPLNPDTDGDGYSDGQEVKNGFNPNGSGKLLNIPAASAPSNVSATTTAPVAPATSKP